MATFAIGFGSTEQDFEQSEEAAISAYAAQRYAEMGCDYFSDDFMQDVRDWLKARADEYHAASARFKTDPDHPSRYSEYWPWVVADASHLIVILSVHHINRRHAFSQDGWALMRTERLVHLRALDLDDMKRSAAA